MLCGRQPSPASHRQLPATGKVSVIVSVIVSVVSGVSVVSVIVSVVTVGPQVVRGELRDRAAQLDAVGLFR